MPRAKKLINPKEASLAATFYEPAYQRLRIWHQGQAVDLLCFTQPVSEGVASLLKDCGALPSTSFRANCFSAVWELPHDDLLRGRFAHEPSGLDRAISEAMGCQAGKYSAAAGLMQWGDHQEQAHARRHFQSRLLMEGNSKRRWQR